MGLASLFNCLCITSRPSDPREDQPSKLLNDLVFHTRHSLPVTFDQLRSSYADHCDDYELRGCIITRLDFCREQRKPRHAYLVAHVARKGADREIGCIRIDRACPCGGVESQPSFSRSVPLFAAPAGDRAQIIDAPGRAGRPSDVIFTHTFDDDHTPSLLHLIAAGLVLRSVERLGRDPVEPCYLCAAAMFRVLAGGDYVAAETKKMEKRPRQGSRWFGGGRTVEHSQCISLLDQKDIRHDTEALDKDIARKLRELQIATQMRQMGEKRMERPGGRLAMRR